MIFMNTESSKTNEPHIFALDLSQWLDLWSSNKHVFLHVEKYNKKVQKQWTQNDSSNVEFMSLNYTS